MRTQVQSLALLSGLRICIAMSCSVGHRHGSDPALLWLWCRPGATDPIWPLVWEPPYTMDVALKRQKKKKPNPKCSKTRLWWWLHKCTNLLKAIELCFHSGWINCVVLMRKIINFLWQDNQTKTKRKQQQQKQMTCPPTWQAFPRPPQSKKIKSTSEKRWPLSSDASTVTL